MNLRPSRRLFGGGGVVSVCVAFCLSAGVASAALPDNRGWELVSPVEKNGGQVDPPGTITAGGVLQAAAAGGAVTYSSRTAFGADAGGAPPASQYLAIRSNGGWATADLTVPILSGSYDYTNEGVPYQAFSPDLVRGLLLNGSHCRGEASGCAVPNPPLAGTDAPEGFQNYYLREGASFTALLDDGDVAGRGFDPASFNLRFAGGLPDLSTVVLSTCAPLTPGATDGCGGGEPNLYRWSRATGALTLINTAPGAALAAQAAAVSADGSRIYWKDLNSGNLYLRQGGATIQVDSAAAGGGAFETASLDGSVAFFTKDGHLWRYAGGSAAELSAAGGVMGVLGASADGSRVYYQDAGGLRLWKQGITVTVAPGPAAADPGTYPPATGRARVTADGSRLLFVSKASLTGYNNTDAVTLESDSEAFLYDADVPSLTCVSCNPKGKRPIGPSTIPGAYPNGSAPGSFAAYKPRALSANGRRVFFDSSDALVEGDSNADPISGTGVRDVYQWEAQGEGPCAQSGGCVAIITSGSAPQGGSFADASADGSDAYLLTAASLVGTDPGSLDLYDARVGGGFPEPAQPIACEGDACRILPPEPYDPTLGTVEQGAGNPPVVYRKYCRKGYVKRKGICVKKGSRHQRRSRHHRHRKGSRG